LAIAISCSTGPVTPSPSPPIASPTQQPTVAAATPTATSVKEAPPPPPTHDLSACDRFGVEACVRNVIGQISQDKMWDHLRALAAVGSRDVRHPGHAKAVTYIKEQLGAMPNVKVESHRATYQSIPLENILAFIDPRGGAPKDGWILISAHYDSVANRTPGWRPAVDPAPGADDNATGTAALLEYARILSNVRLKQRIVLAFFDGEELLYKGSAAYVQSLPTPYPYKAAINIDMVGYNPVADRLDLLWYTNASADLRDRVIAAEERYAIGVQPLKPQASDANTIMDAAPFGVAGIPSVALTQRYGEIDAHHPGNFTFHTVNDTPDKITNPRLWLKAAKLALAVAVELATVP
jgi:hypothetical protein